MNDSLRLLLNASPAPTEGTTPTIDPALWEKITTYAQTWYVKLALALVALWIVWRIVQRVRHALRRRRPVTLHPKLQQYGGAYQTDEKLIAQRRTEAARILATSSTEQIAGYDLIEQVETVFVDGFRNSTEALEGLKATAAMKGANAVINTSVTTIRDRGTLSRCAARGDAVIVRKRPTAEPAPDPSAPPKDNGGAQSAPGGNH